MELHIVILAVFFCQAKSQLCITPSVSPQVVANTPILAAPQLVTTTVVDNSVATALANALQLLIVSDIIENKLGASCVANLLNINPILETVAPCYPTVDYITPCSASVELISPYTPVIETIIPNYAVTDAIYRNPYGVIEPLPYLGCSAVTPLCTEIVSANYGFTDPCVNAFVSPCLPEVITPGNCYGYAESISPNCIKPNIFAPICTTDVISVPTCNTGCFRGLNEMIIPYPYNPYGEIITPLRPCGVAEVVSPCGPNYGAFPEVVASISPCFGSVPEFITPYNNYCGISEIMSPISAFNPGRLLPDVITPCTPYYGSIPEVVTPISPCYGNVAEFLTPFNTYGGIADIISPLSPFIPSCGLPDVVAPCSQYYGGIPEVISPVYTPGFIGVPELTPVNPFGLCRTPDIVMPCTTFPEVILPSTCSTGCDFFGPAAFETNYCGGNPFSSFAQFPFNNGYLPPSAPCINFESAPFGRRFC